MFHDWIFGLGAVAIVVAVVIWMLKIFFGAAISNIVSNLFRKSPDEERLDEWRVEVRKEASRLIHIWESHDAGDSGDRDEMQDAFANAYENLDELLVDAPRLAENKEKHLIGEVLDACDGIDEQEIRTKWGPVNLDDPDAEVTTVGKTEDEITRDFSNQSKSIVSKAKALRSHIEEIRSTGLLPFR